jgi:hypothetical protein
MYIQAASLFGEHHRFTLLRGALLLEAVLKARTGFNARPEDFRTMWVDVDVATLGRDPAARREWWLAESVQRYTLLCILMDNASKLAHIGCSTGWLRHMDAKRGAPQILMISFEPINAAVQRLRQLR